MNADVLIIGSGIAGLSIALKLAERNADLAIAIVTKKQVLDSNTNLAQGGIAIVSDLINDSFDKHISDTLLAGDGLCDPKVVQMVVTEGPERLYDLIRWGICFDRDANSDFALGREGGHTASRVLHYMDITGNHIAKILLKRLTEMKNVSIFSDHFVIDLLTRSNGFGGFSCQGATVLDVLAGKIKIIYSSATVITSGGIGQVYGTTTNPLIATGDGVAMANRAGAAIRDMEFIQFHPTALHCGNNNPAFLISEAVRGYGGHVLNGKGERFLFKYDERGELASRDIVSRAIHHELIVNQDEAVFIDCRHLPSDDFKKDFPSIFEHCRAKGIDVFNDRIPVSPAAHYLCGGIEVSLEGESSIQNLYACGECSRTGLHGANRLASNSLLEALVYAHRIALKIQGSTQPVPNSALRPEIKTQEVKDEQWIDTCRNSLRCLMNSSAGIVRNYRDLATALDQLARMSLNVEKLFNDTFPSVSLLELRNMIEVARLILQHSIDRKENRGTYFNTDLS